MALSSTQHHFAKMYLAAFLRAPELGGLNYWVNEANSGKSLQQVGGIIFSLPIVTDIYSASLSDRAFVEAIYGNVFGRASDIGGLNYWSNEIATLRASYTAQGASNAAFEARGQLVANMMNAGLGTPDGTDGKAYIVNRLSVVEYAAEKQLTTGQEISVANLLSVEAGVGAHPDTVAMGKCRIDSFYDTETPTQTVFIDNIRDDFGALTGNIAHNGTTDDTTPTLQGHVNAALAACETITIYRDGQSLGAAQAIGTSWSFTDPGMGRLGIHTYTARVEDLAGHRGGLSNGYTISVTSGSDTTPPLPPSLSINDTGASNSDGLTNDGIVTVSSLEAGASWEYSTNGGGFWIAGAGTTFMLSGNGAKTVIARQIDASGNTSGNSSALGFTLDVTAPMLISAELIDELTIVLTYNEPLNPSADAAPTHFEVFASGNRVAVSAADANGSSVTLTLASVVYHGQSVSLNYNPPATSPSEDRAGNDAAALANQAVANLTPVPIITPHAGKMLFDGFGVDSFDSATAIAVRNDGSFIVSGTQNGGASDFNFALAFFNPFGGLTNYSTVDFFGNRDEVNGMAVQANGGILLAGYTHTGLNEDFALARFNSDGSLDGSFGIGGIVNTPIDIDNDVAKSITLQADGKILLAGSSYASAFSNDVFALARYNTNGSLDTSFGSGGKVLTDISAGVDRAQAIALQTDGKILVTGSARGGNHDLAIVRYTTDGNLDTTFGNGGKVVTDFGRGDDFGSSIQIFSDGKILIGGAAWNGSNYDFALARYTSAGVLDASFGSAGKVVTDLTAAHDYSNSLNIQNDGKILLSGASSSTLFTPTNFGLVRYNSDGSLDSTFDNDGKTSTDFLSGYDQALSTALLADGDILVAGYANNGRNSDFALARYNPDGSLDSNFGGQYFLTMAADSLRLSASRFDNSIINTRFEQSSLGVLDSLKNFVIGSQHISVGLPVLSLTRTADVGATADLARSLDYVFNGVIGAQRAGLVVVTGGDYQGTYLYVNNEDPAYSDSDDIFIKLDNPLGTLGAVGALSASDYFV